VIDGSHKVYVYNINGGLLGSWTAQGLTTPEDITTDGTNIWIVDDGAKRVFKFSNAASRLDGSQSPDDSFALTSSVMTLSAAPIADASMYVALRKMGAAPSAIDEWKSSFGSVAPTGTPSFDGNAKGIVTDGENLWVVSDGATDQVFKYKLDGTLIGSWSIDSRNGSPTGITLDPSNISHLWIVDSEDDAVYRYHAAAYRTSDSQSADQVFALAGGNGNAQGIADPPPAALETALEPAADFAFSPSESHDFADRLKDRAITEWSTPIKSELLPAGRTTHRTALKSTPVEANASLLASQLTVLDAAFAVRARDASINNDDVSDWLFGEEYRASDEVVADLSDERLATIGA
jgi:hypothetical protein